MIRVLFNFTKFFLLLIFFFGNIYQLNANYHLVDDKILNNVYFEHNNKQNENQLLDDEVLDRVYFDHKSQQIEDSYDNKFQVDRFKYDEEEIIQNQEISPYKFDLFLTDHKEKVEKRFFLANEGYQHLLNGDYETAIFFYNRFLSEYGRDLDVLTGIASAYHRLGDIASAKRYYKDVLLESPNHLIALNNYIVLVGEDSPEIGINELSKIAKLGKSTVVIAQMGYFYALLNDVEKAKESFEKAYKLNSQNLKLSYNLALSYDKLGDYKNAAFLYKKILINAQYRSDAHAVPLALIEKRYNKLNKLKK